MIGSEATGLERQTEREDRWQEVTCFGQLRKKEEAKNVKVKNCIAAALK